MVLYYLMRVKIKGENKMTKQEMIEKMVEGIFDNQSIYRYDPDGPDVWECPFCLEYSKDGVPNHTTDCIVNIAKEYDKKYLD